MLFCLSMWIGCCSPVSIQHTTETLPEPTGAEKADYVEKGRLDKQATDIIYFPAATFDYGALSLYQYDYLLKLIKVPFQTHLDLKGGTVLVDFKKQVQTPVFYTIYMYKNKE